MATLIQRGKKGTWWIKYRVGDRQVYHSLHTTHRRVAEKAKRQVEADADRGDLLAPSRTPIPGFIEGFIAFLRTVRTHKSLHNDISVLRMVFGPVCPALVPKDPRRRDDGSAPTKRKQPKASGDSKVEPLAAKHLEEVTTAMVEQYLTRRVREDGIAPKTVNRSREVLHRMFNYARKQCGYINPDRRTPNPISDVERRAEPARSIRFLTQAQIDQQLAVLADDPTTWVMVAVMIYAGLRREEVTWLTRRDINLSKRLIHVRAKTIDDEYWQPKTRRNRVVPISAALLEVLEAYRSQPLSPSSRRVRDSVPGSLPGAGAVPGAGVWYFPSPQGCRWHPDNFSHRLSAINAKHKLAWSALDYRHTFGSHLAQKGESLYKIATLMGNSPEICRKHYASLVPEVMHDVVEFQPSPPTPSGHEEAARPVPRASRVADGGTAEHEPPRLRLVR